MNPLAYPYPLPTRFPCLAAPDLASPTPLHPRTVPRRPQGNQRDLVVEWETRRSQFLADHAAAALTATTTTTGAASNAAGGGYTPRQSVGGHKQLWIFFKRELVLQLTKKCCCSPLLAPAGPLKVGGGFGGG